LLESSMVNNLGFNINTDADIRKDATLFGEGQSRVVVSINPTLVALFEAELKDLPFTKLGTVSANEEIHIDGDSWGYVSDWKQAYDSSLEKKLSGE